MRKVLLTVGACFVFAPFTLAAPGAVRCGKLLDVRSGRMLADQVVVFDENGVITAVGPAASTKLPGGVAAIDLSAATCLPGLIDVHTHLTGDPSSKGYQGLGISVPREAITGVKNARLTLRAGLTTVRNVGASGFTDVALRDGINAGEIEGPRMLVSGPPLGITGGHCDNNLLPRNFITKPKASPMALGLPAPKFVKRSNTAPTSSRFALPAASSAKAISPARRNIPSKKCKPLPRKPTSSAAKSPHTPTARSPSRTPSAPASTPSSTPA